MPARGGDFWSAKRSRNQEWIDAWTGDLFVVPDEPYFVYGPEQDPINLRCAYGDSSVYLLNPKIVGAGDEWEAGHFANWGPGAYRYQSFAEMMLAHYQDFQSKLLDGF